MGSYGVIHDAGGNIKISPSPYPEAIASGGGSLQLHEGVAYMLTGVNANLTITLDTTNIYTDYEARYNIVLEYISGTITFPSNIKTNVDMNTFTFEANTWYEIDFKLINGYVFGNICKYY